MKHRQGSWSGALLWLTFAAVACGRSTHNDGSAAATNDGGDAGSPENGGRAGASSGGAGATRAGSNTGAKAGVGNSAGAPGDGGEPSSAGTPGDGGSPATDSGGGGGAETELPPSPVCDDGNSCTVDSFVAGSCRHDAVADLLPCDDGNLCTVGDSCLAGVCTPGALQSGAGYALGSIETYGLDLAVASGDADFAFVDVLGRQGRVTSATVDAGVLKKRGQAPIDQAVGFSFIATAWDDMIAVADGDTSFGLNGPSRNMQLFSREADGSLTAHTIAPITPGAQEIPANGSMAGRGSRLLLCQNWAFFGAAAGTLMWWDVSDPDLPVLIAQGTTNGQCGSVAISEDGDRAYVNTVNGVLWTDLSTWVSGALTFAAARLVATDAGLSLRGDRVVARSADLLRVFDESDHTLLATFTVPGANGATLTDAGIFVESDLPAGDGTENFVSLYSLTGDLLQQLSVSKLAFQRDIASAKAPANAGYAMDALTHRLFAAGADGFTEQEAPGVGAMNQAFFKDEAVHVRGSLAAQRVDVSNPVTPVIVAGGPTREAPLGIKLDTSSPSARLLPEADPTGNFFSGPDPATVGVDPARGHATQTLVESVSTDTDEHYVAGNSFQLPGGAATLLSAGDFVYRAARVGDAVHFQRWLTSDLLANIKTPSFDLHFDAPASAATAVDLDFDVDPTARVAVLTTLWVDAGTNVANLYWIDLTTDPPTIVNSVPPSTLATLGVRVRGIHALQAVTTPNGSKLYFLNRFTGIEGALEIPDRITRLLAFDGTTAYYAIDGALAAMTNKLPAPVVTLNLPMLGTPASLTSAATSLVAISAGQLMTLAPACN